MFDNLSDKIQGAFDKIRGYGKINEDNISEVTRELRLVLLDADVNYQVVKKFISNVKEKALGEEVAKSLKPSEVFIKIVHDQLISLLGEDALLSSASPLTIMLVGLQGSGKTTTIGKLAKLLLKQKYKKALLIAADVYRPAAIDQLKQIGASLDVSVYAEDSKNVASIVENGLKYARENKYDLILIDTAGRLHIDEALMNELTDVYKVAKPQETLLVIDSMMGQDALNVITGFNEQLQLTGAILTKLDGDTKGGVALSIRELTNVPIKFVGVSEKLDGIQAFSAKRMADRILGMGDILSIVEKVEDVIDQDSAKKTADRMKKGLFDLEDFLDQLKQMKKMGPLENIVKMLPGASKMMPPGAKVDPSDLAHTEAIILSMTPYERRHPEVLKASRKVRIAKGSGLQVSDVNRLLKQYDQMKMLMKQIKNGNFKLPF